MFAVLWEEALIVVCGFFRLWHNDWIESLTNLFILENISQMFFTILILLIQGFRPVLEQRNGTKNGPGPKTDYYVPNAHGTAKNGTVSNWSDRSSAYNAISKFPRRLRAEMSLISFKTNVILTDKRMNVGGVFLLHSETAFIWLFKCIHKHYLFKRLVRSRRCLALIHFAAAKTQSKACSLLEWEETYRKPICSPVKRNKSLRDDLI